jgi:crossover junction endodeoxyribonuclease RuvC
MLKIIGIDPGLAETGIGIVWGKGVRIDGYAHGTIYTQKSDSSGKRLEKIYTKLIKVLEDEAPNLMLVEDVFSLTKYPKSGIYLGKVVGVVLLAGSQKNIPSVEVPVREVKQVLTGNGNADKKQVEMSVRHHLNATAPLRPFHVSDALGLALIGLFRYQSLKPS